MSIRVYFLTFLFVLCDHVSLATIKLLDQEINTSILCIEIENDAVWEKDSGYTGGWSVQYHTQLFARWNDSKAPQAIRWIGNKLLAQGNDDSVLRYSHGIGQNIIAPGNLATSKPQKGDLPYAGTLTYSLCWQRFNLESASAFQLTVGLLGQESFAGELQTFLHKDLNWGESPEGWCTQRDTEPIINLAYLRMFTLSWWKKNNGWAGHIYWIPMTYLGNQITGVDLAVCCRFGRNIRKGFSSLPSPAGYGFFMHTHRKDLASENSHGFEFFLACKTMGMIYSVFFDGSLLTNDTRKVERNKITYSGIAGIRYHLGSNLSIGLDFIYESDLLIESSLPRMKHTSKRTDTHNSYGSLSIRYSF